MKINTKYTSDTYETMQQTVLMTHKEEDIITRKALKWISRVDEGAVSQQTLTVEIFRLINLTSNQDGH